MAIRKVARLGHPVLRQKARKLSLKEIKASWVKGLIADMIETMEEYSGIGLAAPQVHESIQLAVIGYSSKNGRYPGIGSQPLTVFINPKITVLDPAKQTYWEGCLSVPGMRGQVTRPRKIKVDYLNHKGAKKQWIAEGFLATVFQHEFDHLEGVIYVDRLKSLPGLTPLVFQDEYDKYIAPKGENELED